MLHLSGNFKAYLSTNTTPVPNSSISPTAATFDKKSGSTNNNDITVTMALNGNTFANIKNGNTTLINNTDYTVSGSTVTIKKTYLAAQSVGTTTLTFNFSAGMARDIVITVVDTTNSSISPTTAIFDKRTDLQADITVNMTLNGNTLSSIRNGSATLANGTNYTVNGSTVTIKKEYLAAQSVGTTTLTFTFNAGAASSLVITVKESPQGGGTGTSYDFAVDTFPAGYPKYADLGSSTLSATIGMSVATGGDFQGKNVLIIDKNAPNSNPKFILPFDLGNKTLADFSSIVVVARGVSGDITYKVLIAQVGATNTKIGECANNGFNLSTTNGNATSTITIPITISNASSYTGEIEIGFVLNNPGGPRLYEISTIRLVPKP